jgi:hypothetical protein
MLEELSVLSACDFTTLSTRLRARAFRSRCQRHRKDESQHDVNGCSASRIRLHYLACPTTADRMEAPRNQIDAAIIFARFRKHTHPASSFEEGESLSSAASKSSRFTSSLRTNFRLAKHASQRTRQWLIVTAGQHDVMKPTAPLLRRGLFLSR